MYAGNPQQLYEVAEENLKQEGVFNIPEQTKDYALCRSQGLEVHYEKSQSLRQDDSKVRGDGVDLFWKVSKTPL